MSMWTTIECDWCGSSWDEEETPYLYESIEVDEEFYEHICEDCFEADIFYCEHCDAYHRSDYATEYCENLDYMPCEYCVEEAHAADSEWTGYCDACEYESEDYDPSQRPGAWVKIIG